MQNIDQFFKEKNDAFEIGSEQKEMHWQEMQRQIIAKQQQAKYSSLAIGISSAVAILVAGIIFFTNQDKNYTKAEPTVASTTANSNSVAIENTVVNNKPAVVKEKENPAPKLVTAATSVSEIDQTSFYIDLSKQPELFEIDASKTTTVTSKAGAIITVPTNNITLNNAPVTGNITMTLQEYYKAGTNAAMLKFHFYQNDVLLTVANENAIEVKLPKQNASLKQLTFYNQTDNIADGLLQQMQWASTDRFAADSKNKVDYTITLPTGYNAKTFVSFLAFTNQKVLIPGDVVGNSIVFKNIPKAELVYFISLGKASGKFFICNKKLITTTREIKDLNFLETSEGFYMKKFDELSALAK